MIVLVYTYTSPYPYHKMIPLSIVSLGCYLEQKGIEVEYFDERIHNKQRLFDFIKKKPVLVGFSAMTCYQIKSSLNLAKK
ncbi:MAG: hypothetical protein HY999_02665 [Nitrospinae bacterium]|nr:hypothetical protein [Nitrospinota bacterium]